MALAAQCSESYVHSTDPGWCVNGDHVVKVGHWKLDAFGLQLLVNLLHFFQFWHTTKCICPCLEGNNKFCATTKIIRKIKKETIDP